MQLNKERNFRISIFIVGFTTLIAQIIIFRSFLAVFKGNELVIGVALANWLLLSSFGVYLGQYIRITKIQSSSLLFMHLIFSFLPLLTDYLICISYPFLFPRGKGIALPDIYMFILVYLAPISISSGLFISVLSKLLSLSQKANKIAENYAIGAFGGLIGGLLFNFVLIVLFREYLSLKLLMVLNIAIGLILYFTWVKSRLQNIFGVIALIFAGYLLTNNLEELAYDKQYNVEKHIQSLNTRFGQICITNSEGENNFYENGNLVGSTNDVVTAEESVHYAMLQHAKPQKILIISGALNGALDQLNKYKINSIDYVEVNPELIKLHNSYARPLANYPEVNVIKEDARQFLRKYDKKYDVVLINLPDPDNIMLNRYFTANFFEELKQRLKPNSIISISLSSTSEYMNREMIELHSSIFSTLKLLFENVIIIPGQRDYFLASDKNLTHMVSRFYDAKNITNAYVNPYYIDEDILTDKIDQIEKISSEKIIINYDFDPIVFQIQFIRWIDNLNLSSYILALILIIILIFVLPRFHFVNFGIFSTGFSISSLQLILIFAFQTMFGYVYYMMGVFFTLFLLGTLIGSIWLVKKIKISFKNFSFVQYLLGIVSVLVPVILFNIQSSNENAFFIHSVFIIIILAIGMLVGLQFVFGTHLRYASISKTATGTIGSDMLGGATGALLVTIILIPLFGIIKVSLIIGIINFIAGLVVLIRSGKNNI